MFITGSCIKLLLFTRIAKRVKNDEVQTITLAV